MSVPFPDTPNISSRIASSLPIPFEGQPIVCSDQVSEDETFELMTIEVLEVYRLYYAIRHLAVQVNWKILTRSRAVKQGDTKNGERENPEKTFSDIGRNRRGCT